MRVRPTKWELAKVEKAKEKETPAKQGEVWERRKKESAIRENDNS